MEENLPEKKDSENKTPAIKAIGKKNLSAVFLAATEEERAAGKSGRVIEFSAQEAVVLKVFLSTHDYAATAKEAEITVESVKRMLRRPNCKRYLKEVIAKAAIMSGTDQSWMMMELRYVWEGAKKPDQAQMAAMAQMAKLIAPVGKGVTVNVQQNSFYSNINKDALNAEWDDARAAAVDGI